VPAEFATIEIRPLGCEAKGMSGPQAEAESHPIRLNRVKQKDLLSMAEEIFLKICN
jgi:hypothetical protein